MIQHKNSWISSRFLSQTFFFIWRLQDVEFWMLSGVKRPACVTKQFWFDSRHHIWHPIDIIHLNSNGTACYVQLLKTNVLFDYFATQRIWVDKISIDAFEVSPNRDIDYNLNYVKSIHPFYFSINFEYKFDMQFFGRTINNTTDRTVHILLFIIGH